MAGELGEYQQLADAQVVDAIGAQQVDQALQSPIDEAHLLAVHHRSGRLLEVAGTELDVLQPTAAYRLEPVAGEYLPPGILAGAAGTALAAVALGLAAVESALDLGVLRLQLGDARPRVGGAPRVEARQPAFAVQPFRAFQGFLLPRDEVEVMLAPLLQPQHLVVHRTAAGDARAHPGAAGTADAGPGDGVFLEPGELVAPDQHPRLHSFAALRLQQFADSRSVGALEAHGRVEAPGDDVDAVPGRFHRRMHRVEGRLAIDQRLDVHTRARWVEGLVGEPVEGQPDAAGLLRVQLEGLRFVQVAHGVGSSLSAAPGREASRR